MSGGLKIGFLTTVGAVSLLLTACTSTGTAEKTATSTGTPEQSASSTEAVEQTTETLPGKIIGEQDYEPGERSIFCTFCGSNNVKEGSHEFTCVTEEPEACPRDHLSFEPSVVLVSTDCVCLDCGESWVQAQRYSVSLCPVHGIFSWGYSAYVQTEQTEQTEQSETEQ